jgi:Tfp pilus assembly protein PilW
MLASPLSALTQPGDEQGFTLIELLVAMIAGLVIVGALLAILEISLRQDTRISDRVQADRIGRTAMTNMLDELHSTCTGFGSGAIQPPTTTPTSPLATTGPLNLWFLTAYGSATSGAAAATGVTLHDVNWTPTKLSNTNEQLGTLTDYSWSSTGGEPPVSAWTFNGVLSTATANRAHVLATNVVPQEGSTIFRYAKYDTTSSDAAYGELVPMTASELPLTSVTARKVAQATIGYTQAPADGDTRAGHTTSYSSAVVLRLTPTESSGEGTTCA